MARTLLACLLVWLPLVFASGVRPMIVVGASMQPALLPGQLVLLHRDYYRSHPLGHGHVVAFRWKGKVFVKRVEALEGESVSLLCQQGQCMPLPSEADAKGRLLARQFRRVEYRSVKVPRGYFFSLGDNYGNSLDSRDLGPIPVSAIIGRVAPLWGARIAVAAKRPALA